ncbi:MAG: tetratricopeptide (TPR) repeat protein [Mariniblastus sp.]
MATIEEAIHIGRQAHQAGNFPAAEKIYKQILEHSPQHPDALHLLGLMAHQVGKNDIAVELIAAAIQASPQNPLYFNNLGEACKALGKLELAEKAYRQATNIADSASDVWLNLGNLLLQQERLDEAVEIFQKCLQLNPEFVSAKINLATALIERGDGAEALEVLEQLLKDFPKNAHLHSHYGLALQRTGQDNPAKHYLKAIELAPNEAEFYYQLASTSPNSLKPEHVANLQRIADSKSSHVDAAHFALGLYHQSQQQHAPAWQAFSAGNAALQGEYLRQENETLTQRIVAQYDAPFFSTCPNDTAPAQTDRAQTDRAQTDSAQTDRAHSERAHSERAGSERAGSNSDNATGVPIYIVSMPRSGSTLVEQILASHPLAHGLGESRVLHRIQKMLIAGDTQGRDFPMAAANMTSELLQQLRLELYRNTFDKSDGANWVIDKTLDNHRFLGLVAQLQPTARIIVCHRDPRDIFTSCFSHRFKNLPHTRSLEDLEHYYEQFQQLVTHWETTLPLPIHTVQYEQLVEAPDSVTRQLVAFCGMPWSDDCLAFERGNKVVKTASLDQVRKPIYKTSVGRWEPYAEFLSGIHFTV